MSIFINNANELILSKLAREIEIELTHDEKLRVDRLTKKGLSVSISRIIVKSVTNVHDVIQRPYSYIGQIPKYQFRHADILGKNIPIGDKTRLTYLTYASVYQACKNSGHLFITEGHLKRYAKYLGENTRGVPDGFRPLDYIDSLVASEMLKVVQSKKGKLIYTFNNYLAEDAAAWKIGKLLKEDSFFGLKALRVEETLSKLQAEAVSGVLANKVSLITGLPGTGKSYTCKTIVRIAKEMGGEVLLVAPTGIAAKRLAESCDHPAYTCHKAIFAHANPNSLDRPFDSHLVIVDETSMLDQQILAQIISLLGEKSSIVFVGDTEQLPSVGEGEVLYNLIKADRIPRWHLDEIHRSASDSAVTLNAHRIKDSKLPTFNDLDYRIIEDYTVEDILAEYTHGDCKLLSPSWKGDFGVTNLNAIIRDNLNKSAKAWTNPFSDITYMVNDKIIVMDNNYELGVVNGDTGTLVGIHPFVIKLEDDSRVLIKDQFMRESIVHAYCTTVHKSQGMEFDKVILIWPNFGWSKYKQLLYTALTRAKKEVVIFGSKRDVLDAIKKDTRGKRNSLLWRKIQVSHDS